MIHDEPYKKSRSAALANCNSYLSVITHKLQSDLFDYTFSGIL